MTLPLQLAMSVVAASSIAIAARHEPPTVPFIRSWGLWALVLMQLVVVVPITVYLLVAYPDWTLMYAVESSGLPVPTSYLAVLVPLVAIGAFVLTTRLLRRGRLVHAVAIVALGVGATASIGYVGRTVLSEVATSAAFQAADADPLPIVETPLVYLLSVFTIVWLASFASTLLRLRVLSPRRGHRVAQSAPTMLRPSKPR